MAELYALENTAPNQPPVFSGGTATFTTAENNASASFIISATDPDGDVLTYTKTGADADKFTLNVTTGELTWNAAPDYEANASAAGNNAYSVTVTVTDGEANATQSVTVNVTDDPADNPIDLTQGLVAWYPFDGNASDMSGNGQPRHGQRRGQPWDWTGTGLRARPMFSTGWMMTSNSPKPSTTFRVPSPSPLG